MGNWLSAEILLPLVRASVWILLVLVHWSPLVSSYCELVLALVWWLVTGSWHVLSWSFITTQIVSLLSHLVPSERQAGFISTSSHLYSEELSESNPTSRDSSATHAVCLHFTGWDYAVDLHFLTKQRCANCALNSDLQADLTTIFIRPQIVSARAGSSGLNHSDYKRKKEKLGASDDVSQKESPWQGING